MNYKKNKNEKKTKFHCKEKGCYKLLTESEIFYNKQYICISCLLKRIANENRT